MKLIGWCHVCNKVKRVTVERYAPTPVGTCDDCQGRT